ncbi:acyl-CoA thioesterase [Facilibium subflavum]|uniref:acyl-CoA thioesterase n=1 Tax=Facilibium subflavum TaxID=2219058 RepID=UPI000E657EF5|nr:acyl-CoA thioesterase [Facilibium subflavum]
MQDNTSILKPKDNYGDLVLRVVPMPADSNSGGSIFGGWLLSQIDIGASIAAIQYCHARVVTRSVDNVEFLKPIFAHSLVDVYAKLNRVGKTSIRFDVHVFVTTNKGENYLTAKAQITFVKIDNDRKPSPLHH